MAPPARVAPVVHVVGARPNFMKAAPVISALSQLGVSQQLVHTGQHYDASLSAVFFHQLRIPEPDVNLGVGSGSHAEQTASIMVRLEQTLADVHPALVVVYGDVNSTLAAALVAAKLLIPLAHVEAGLRSFDDTMPEEINRRVTDALSELLFVTSPEAMAHLAHEGRPATGMHFVGNPMIDTLVANRTSLDTESICQRLDVRPPYGVVTLHRPNNVDDPDRAGRIVDALRSASELVPLVVPLHPRGRENMARAGLTSEGGIRVIDPLGYLEFMSLLAGSRLALTDSGGIQEETTALGVPCITVRPNTERPVTISHGTNRLAEPDEIVGAVRCALDGAAGPGRTVPPLWDGNAGARIGRHIADWLASQTAPSLR